MRSSTKRAGALATLLFAALAFMPGVAEAGTGGGDLFAPQIPAGTPLQSAIASGRSAVGARLLLLSQLSSLVAHAKTLTTGDRFALTQVIASDESALSQLQISMTSAASLAALSAEEATMVLDYHVISLVGPVTRDVVNADRSLAAEKKLARQVPEIEATISASGLTRARQVTASLLLSELSGRLSSASASLSGVVPELLALTPTAIPGSLPVLSSTAEVISVAAGDIKSASGLVATITTLIAGPGPAVRAKR